MTSIIIDEETYLAKSGASRLGIGEAALHKNIPHGRTRERLLRQQSKEDWKLIDGRETLRVEYRKQVEAGELRPPTRRERLIAVATGDPDNISVQAARRLLNKKGAKCTTVHDAEDRQREHIARVV